ncbi:MAG TPA: hypothetical protein PLS10_07710, partial [Chitinophagales bacterium]|nr:hypothetical protein [Chitinophagales bacterium]
IIDSSNKELKKNTSEFFVNIDDLDESRKPYYKYAQDFLTLVEKLLPTEKIEEINFDSENDIVYTLEIRIKTAYTKANEKNREVFVLIISHDSIYNTEEEGKVKKTYGGIAGAGMPEQQNTPEKLAIFVLKTITDRLN